MQVQVGKTYLMANESEVHIDGSAGFFLKRYFNSANPSEYWYETGTHSTQDAGKKLIVEKSLYAPAAPVATPAAPVAASAGKTLVEVDWDARTVRVL